MGGFYLLVEHLEFVSLVVMLVTGDVSARYTKMRKGRRQKLGYNINVLSVSGFWANGTSSFSCMCLVATSRFEAVFVVAYQVAHHFRADSTARWVHHRAFRRMVKVHMFVSFVFTRFFLLFFAWRRKV